METEISGLPVQKIAELLDSAEPGEVDRLLFLLESDPRKGAKRLLESRERNFLRREKERRRIESSLRFERELRERGFVLIAGVDEAGRGALAGPLVAAAVILPENCDLGIRDSKEILPEKREGLFEAITRTAIGWSTAEVPAEEIDEVGLAAANRLALMRAVEALPVLPDYLLSDAFPLDGTSVPVMAVIKGDKVSASVGAASVLAKVTRDRLMRRFHRRFPSFYFDQNKGYGTAEHLEALRKNGPCSLHRRSFRWG